MKKVNVFQVIFLINSETNEDITAHAIALDLESSASIFVSPDFLSSIGRTPMHLELFMSRDIIKFDMMGFHENLKVRFDPNSIANVLSLSYAANKCRVVIDILNDKSSFHASKEKVR